MNTKQNRQAIGFVGIGVMGAPMSAHLHRAGHAVTLLDLDPIVAQTHADALGAGACATRSLRELAERSDIVITMLPNGTVVQQAVLAEDGLAAGFRPGSLLLDTSSSEPWLTQQTAAALAKGGVSMVDAPVSGAQWGAQKAELVFMAGGSVADLQRVRPVLERLGNAIFHLGPLGCGHAMKCINNLITAMTLSATAEGLVIGKAYGLDPGAMVEVMNASTSMSWISQTHVEKRILSRRFDDPFKLELMLKDIGIAMSLSREAGVSAPLSGLGQQLWQAASTAAGPGTSISELVRWVENQNGVQVTRPGSDESAQASASA